MIFRYLTPSATTGISPFEAEHGMKARSIADSLVENPTTEGMEASADDLATIATSARAFHKIAAQSSHGTSKSAKR